MSAHVLLSLLNKLRKKDKMRGLPSILSLFHNEFNKFNNTGAGMLDFIYHMPLQIFLKSFFGGVKMLGLCHKPDVNSLISSPSGLSILMHGIISLPDAMSCDKIF